MINGLNHLGLYDKLYTLQKSLKGENKVTYDQAVKTIHSSGTMPDGYFGDRTSVSFGFDKKSGKTLIIHKSDFHDSGLPDAQNKTESLWLLKHHPSVSSYTITKIIKKGYL